MDLTRTVEHSILFAKRRMSRLSVWLLIATLIGLSGLLPGCSTRKGDRSIALEIRREVARPFRWFKKPSVDDDDIQPLVRKFYEKRSYSPAWTHLTGATDDAKDLIKELSQAGDHGLRPADYDVARIEELSGKVDQPLGAGAEPATLATLDIELTRNFLKFATHRFGGAVNPRQLPADWHVQPRKGDMVKVLVAAIENGRVRQELDTLDPPGEPYAKLRAGLVQIRKIESEGGWPAVPAGPAMKKGQSGPRVEALQKRLAASGDLGGGYAVARFDGPTEAGLRGFQERHGLEPDGVVDADDLEQLNATVAQRVRQIELNLERRRWVADSLFRGRYLEVNVPEYAMRVIEDGRPVLGMRVVVGKRFSPTPIFTDEISYLVINPFWNVPSSIATEEILVELKKDPGYLERNNMKLLENDGEDARELDARGIDWNATSAENFRYAIRQDPGPYNPVGHVKFMCPNQFNVYLHDTPSDRLFAESERSLSHGCIRLERPVDLAEYVLRGEGDWSREKILAAFETSHNQSVKLPKPLPVRILYWTAFTDDRGRLQFRDDIYGLDKLLERTLQTPRPSITTKVRA